MLHGEPAPSWRFQDRDEAKRGGGLERVEGGARAPDLRQYDCIADSFSWLPFYTGNKQVIIVRSSSSGFAWGKLIHSHYKSSCLRWILISSHRSYEINEKYARMGKVNEDLHATRLEEQGLTYEREPAFEMPVPSVDGVLNRGHIDFLVNYPTHREVHELKHVQSTNVRREVIKKGLYITDNLAQCVNYMLQAKTDRGVLKYSFYDEKKSQEPLDERAFAVHFEDSGRICVDGSPTKFEVSHQLEHQRQAATVLKHQTVAQRPYLGDQPFVGACNFCPARGACDLWDMGAIEATEGFVELSKQCIEEKEKKDGR